MPSHIIVKSVFWTCFVLIAYSYFVYPALLFLLYGLAQWRRDWQYLTTRKNRRVSTVDWTDLPSVSFLVPAYNEEACLHKKVENLRQLDYPQEKLEVIFVSDGSTDRTNEILASVREANFRVIYLSDRQGKFNALNCASREAQNELFIFSDASTVFDPGALLKLVRHFSDARVGAVCGSIELMGNAESEQTEGAYWKFESMLRLMEGRLGATVTASGAIYALRRECYRPLEPGDIIDDFLIPMNARKLGYRVQYDAEAVATEFSAESVKGEFKRRVRLAMGSFRAMRRILGLPLATISAWSLFSHKILRWILPFLLILLFISNGFLLRELIYRIAFYCQLAFYLWAVLGFLFRERLKRVRFALVGYFLVAIHVAFLVGFWRNLWGQTGSTWERVH